MERARVEFRRGKKLISKEKKKVLDLFQQGRDFYKQMKFKEAKKLFLNALNINKEDGPSKVYLARCNHYIDNPPPADWDGVFVMKTK